jgi:hypothetical protein
LHHPTNHLAKEKEMSSLIEVLKQIQDEQDLDSRTEARNRFDQMSKTFETEMGRAYLAGRSAIRELAAEKMMLAEYWMNQWVGSDPKWHGDWGKALRTAVREIKAGAEVRSPGEELGDLLVENAARQVAEVGEIAPGEATVEPESEPVLEEQIGTVKSGRFLFDARRNLETGEILYRTKTGEKTATDKVAATFQAR